MSITNILLHVAGETLEPDRGPAQYAIGLATAFEAHLKALVFQLDVSLPQSAHLTQTLPNAAATFDARNRDAIERAEHLRVHARRAGVTADVLTARSYAYTVPHVVADQARLCDIAVVGVSEAGLLSERSIAEYVLFQSGAPMIIVPQRHNGAFACERVTIAWDFGRTTARAVRDALPFLHRAKEVTLLTVGGDKAIDTSLTSTQVVASLHRRGIPSRYVQIERQDRAIGDVIQEYAIKDGSQLLVMGGYGHSRFRDFVLGSATRQILASPELPTLLAH